MSGVRLRPIPFPQRRGAFSSGQGQDFIIDKVQMSQPGAFFPKVALYRLTDVAT